MAPVGVEHGDPSARRSDQPADRVQFSGGDADRRRHQDVRSGVERIDHRPAGIRQGDGDQGRIGAGEQLAVVGPGRQIMLYGELLAHRGIGLAQPDDAYACPPALQGGKEQPVPGVRRADQTQPDHRPRPDRAGTVSKTCMTGVLPTTPESRSRSRPA
nr:hypothetical protein [Microlunatus sp. Gsoil 973]